jgi:hypothetical protein
MFDRCRVWRSLLTRRTEGVLSPTERALLDNHLTKCAACRKAQDADEALQAICFAHDAGLAVSSSGTAFDDRVITKLRTLPLVEPKPQGWRARVRACSETLSFEFCMQLAGGGLAAASITAFVLISALNPAPTSRNPSPYELGSVSSVGRTEPPVPLESLFQSPTPRAAMLWAAPGRSVHPLSEGGRPFAPLKHPGPVAAPPRRHGGLDRGLTVT